MSRHHTPQRGDGTVWLGADRHRGDYLCSWYAGLNDDHLVEQARAADASDAVSWGLRRTGRVRIRTTEAHTYWAGTASRPEGFSDTWSAAGSQARTRPSSAVTASPDPR